MRACAQHHFADYFQIDRAELEAIDDLARIRHKQLLTEDPTISGFNLGVNSGGSAGQTVFHNKHIHPLLRRVRDTENPAGGVRKLIGSVNFVRG